MNKLLFNYQSEVDKILQHAVNKIQDLLNKPIALIIVDPEDKIYPLEDLLRAVSQALIISEDAIKGPNRSERVKDARHLYCFLARKMKCYSCETIGEFINRDYSTVSYACKVIEGFIKMQDHQLITKLNKCRIQLTQSSFNNILENHWTFEYKTTSTNLKARYSKIRTYYNTL